MLTENLSTLKIHKLTQEQYDRALLSGNVDQNAIYLTPDEGVDLTPYATIEQLNSKADSVHNHDDIYYTETEIDAKLDSLTDDITNTYETKENVSSKIDEVTIYVDTNFALKSEIGNVNLSNYYNKTEIDNMEFITVEDIDNICAMNIQIASEVMF